MSKSPTNPPAPSPVTLAENLIAAILAIPNYNGHDASLLHSLRVVSATTAPNPRVTTRLTVTSSLCNSTQHLHGGAQALIFDNCTTLCLALVRKEGWWEMAGVTRSLNVTYLGAVKCGEEVEVEGEIVGIGSRLAHLRGVMRRIRDGVVVATCEHGRVNVDPPGRVGEKAEMGMVMAKL